MLHIPVLGLVENMAYFECPSCHGRHFIYGKSNIEKPAVEHHIEQMAQIPIEPQLAKACDQGKIYDFEAPWFKDLTDGLEQLL